MVRKTNWKSITAGVISIAAITTIGGYFLRDIPRNFNFNNVAPTQIEKLITPTIDSEDIPPETDELTDLVYDVLYNNGDEQELLSTLDQYAVEMPWEERVDFYYNACRAIDKIHEDTCTLRKTAKQGKFYMGSIIDLLGENKQLLNARDTLEYWHEKSDDKVNSLMSQLFIRSLIGTEDVITNPKNPFFNWKNWRRLIDNAYGVSYQHSKIQENKFEMNPYVKEFVELYEKTREHIGNYDTPGLMDETEQHLTDIRARLKELSPYVQDYIDNPESISSPSLESNLFNTLPIEPAKKIYETFIE